jgi:hypothetical protein
MYLWYIYYYEVLPGNVLANNRLIRTSLFPRVSNPRSANLAISSGLFIRFNWASVYVVGLYDVAVGCCGAPNDNIDPNPMDTDGACCGPRLTGGCDAMGPRLTCGCDTMGPSWMNDGAALAGN